MLRVLSNLSKVTSVWYFAFGANLDQSILSRRVLATSELSSFPATLEDYRLSFNVGVGLLTDSPSYASVVPMGGTSSSSSCSGSSSGSMVHGVVYELTLPQWSLLCASEGVPVAYKPKVVQVNAYCFKRGKVNAYTLLSSRQEKAGQEGRPSKRYINIIREGARKQYLNEHYIQYLEGIEPFESIR